jgi:histidyl-tRNA synthetase
MRAVDKVDRLGVDGVGALLGAGRKDESGDFTKGAELDLASIVTLTSIFEPVDDPTDKIAQLDIRLRDSKVGQEGRAEIEALWSLFSAAGYEDRIRIDPSVVRGLEYYTGPVFEAELTTPIKDERGQSIRLGSVVSAGRYDGLVEKLPTKVPPGLIGVSRLLYGLKTLSKIPPRPYRPVVVLVLGRGHRRLSEDDPASSRSEHPRRALSRPDPA